MCLCFVAHLQAIFTDPGSVDVPKGLPEQCPVVPEELKADARAGKFELKHCKVCDAWKPARAHHCKTCNRCIFRMDHHCPWINNCVGFSNQRLFVLFLVYIGNSFCSCFFVFIINSHALHCFF